MEVKIVGSVSDENMLEEIENIAKVFIYEQRMKSYIVHPTHHSQIKPRIKFDRKITPDFLGHTLVKGLY